jgi:hypothetical protein
MVAFAVSFRAEDRILVQFAIDECKKLGLERFAPNALMWSAKLPPDQCMLFRSYLLLPQSMNGKLQPEEWRPLITSGVLQRRLVKQRVPIKTFLGWWVISTLALTVAILFGVIIGKEVGVTSLPKSVGSALGLALIPGILASSIFLRWRRFRMQRLKADVLAVDQAGAAGLLQTLLKIQGFDLPAEQSLRRVFLAWPSLTRRIQNLQKTPKEHAHEEFERLSKLETFRT